MSKPDQDFSQDFSGEPPVQKSTKNWTIIIAGFLILGPILTLLFIRSFLVEVRYIPGKSMTPTLQVNDRVMIDKWSYRFQKPQRGDIIAYLATEGQKQQNLTGAFLHRVIGLPREKVEVRGGLVYINNQPLKENYIQEAPSYQWGPVTVPPDSYAVLGDNRNNSYDSHYWGFVPRDKIIGKATTIFLPTERSGAIK